MAEMQELALGRMNNGAHFMYAADILARAEEHPLLSTKLSKQMTAFKAAVEEEDRCLKLSQKNMLTDQIADADYDRDALFSIYKSGVTRYADMRNPACSAPAKILLQHIKYYGIDPQMQLNQETGLLLNFTHDLVEKFATEVEELGYTKLVQLLQEANEKVRSLTSERTDERAKSTVAAMKQARTATDLAYRNWVKGVNALAILEGDEDYAEWIDYGNTEIVQYKRQVLKQKASKPESEPTTPDEPTTPTDPEPEEPEPDIPEIV